MNRRRFAITVGALMCGSCKSWSESIRLYSHQSRQKKYKWMVDSGRFKKTLEWTPESGQEIPLSPRRAFTIGMAWLKRNHSPNSEIATITIQRFVTSVSEYRNRYYYVIEAMTGAFDSMSCVVLMDGTIVEPINDEGVQ